MSQLREFGKSAEEKHPSNSLVESVTTAADVTFVLLNHGYGSTNGGFQGELAPRDLVRELATRAGLTEEDTLARLEKARTFFDSLMPNNIPSLAMDPTQRRLRTVNSFSTLHSLRHLLLSNGYVDSSTGEAKGDVNREQVLEDLAEEIKVSHDQIRNALSVASNYLGVVVRGARGQFLTDASDPSSAIQLGAAHRLHPKV